MSTISSLSAIEILDSRGRPTIKVACTFDTGHIGAASVPSGASTGKAEALELRDADPARYRGLGCRTALKNINNTIFKAAKGKDFTSQSELDQFLIQLDGTQNKSHFGANAILGVSLAFARASAHAQNIPLFEYFRYLVNRSASSLPRPIVNLFSGGKHAGGQVQIQDVLLAPLSTRTIDETLSAIHDVYYCAADLIQQRYGTRPLKADEGGLAPPFSGPEVMFETALEAIEKSGFRPGIDIALAVDVASTHFYRDELYYLEKGPLTSDQMVNRIANWITHYPILSIEDGLSEEDWSSWSLLRQALAGRALTVGDDLLCTNPGRISRAVNSKAADCLLLKVNQVGTLSEAAESLKLARTAGWKVTASARSGETEDHWLADLAAGWGTDHIKIGSITQSDRLAKYNRLLEIEREHLLPMLPWSSA